MKSIEYQVSGLTCHGCVNRVKNKLADYADQVEVTLTPPRAMLINPTKDITHLNIALAEIGDYRLSQTEPQPQQTPTLSDAKSWLSTYKPLLLVIGYIVLTTLLVEINQGRFELHRWMPHFMAGFFIFFSFFKLLDLTGFANSYAMYDLLAKQWKGYGYLYPFIELGLGIGYALAWQPMIINGLTVVILGFSAIGVIKAVSNKQAIQCACLGTGFNLPMSTVTIIEDLLMVVMALAMLIPR